MAGKGKSSEYRAGKRRDRNTRFASREPVLGYYLIVTDTEETEKNYFEGLKNSIPPEIRERIVIKVEKAKTTYSLVERTMELCGEQAQQRIPWIVFDRDQVKDLMGSSMLHKETISMLDGQILVLRYGCLPILGRCPALQILLSAVPGLPPVLKRQQDVSIRKMMWMSIKN